MTDKKKKNITEKVIEKIKTYSESIEDFLGGSDPETGVIGKKRIDKKQWGIDEKSKKKKVYANEHPKFGNNNKQD